MATEYTHIQRDFVTESDITEKPDPDPTKTQGYGKLRGSESDFDQNCQVRRETIFLS